MKMYMSNMELHVITHYLPVLLVLLAVEAFASNISETDTTRTLRSSRRVVRLYSGTRPEPIACLGEGLQSDPVNCAVFYRCMKSARGRYMTFKFQCAPGTIFDPDTQGCNHPSAVKRSNCGIDHVISVNEQMRDNAIDDIKQELPSPITTKLPLYTKIPSTAEHLWSTSAKQQDVSTSFPWLLPTTNHNKASSISTKLPIDKTSNDILREQYLISTRKQRSTTPRVSRKPSARNGDMCRSEGFMGDSENCRKFYRCVNNLRGGYIRYEFMCTEATIWDGDIQSCNHAWAVKKRRCGQGNINEVSNDVNTYQAISSGYTTKEVTPNVNFVQQTFLVSQTQGSSSYFTKKPLTTLTNVITTTSTLVKNPTTPNYFINDRQIKNYVLGSIKGTASQSEENVDGYNNMNTENNKTSSSTDCSENGFMGDENDCKKFYRCVDNGRGSYTKYEFSCGEGTVWDANKEACNHAWAVKECGRKGSTQDLGTSTTITSTVTTTTSTKSTPTSLTTIDESENIGYGDQNPTTSKSPISTSTTQINEPTGSNCISSGFMGSDNDCKIFYRCVDNGDGSYTQYQFTCGEGTVWDPNLETCNHIWAVKECGGKGTTKAPVQGTTATTTSKPSATTSTSTKSTPNYISTAQTTIDEDDNSGYGNHNQETISTKTEPPASINTTPFSKQPGNNCTSSGFMGDEINCKIFYRCVDIGNGDYTRYEFSCGEGTVWDPEIEACNHPWAVDKCGGSSSLTTDKIESSTLKETYTTQTTGLSQNDDSDGGYGIQHDESSSAPEDTLSSSTTVTTTKQPQNSSNNCITTGFIGDQFDCKKFYRCVDDGKGGFTRYEFTCGEGTVWDSTIQSCNHAWAVKTCGGNIKNDTNKEDVTTTSGTTTYTSSSTTTSYENEIDSSHGQSSSQSPSISSTGHPNQENEVPTNECKVSGFMADMKNCKKFYRCVENGNGDYTRYEFVCGEGTIWDQEIQACNHDNGRSCTEQSNESMTKEPEKNNSTLNTNKPLPTTNSIKSTTMSTFTEPNQIQSSPTDSTNNTCISEGFYANSMDCKKFYRCVNNGKGGYTKYDFTCGDGTMWVQDIQACDHQDSDSNCQSYTNKPQQSEDQQSTTGQQSSSVTSVSTENPHDEYQDNSSNPSIQGNDNCSSEGFYPNGKDCKKFYRCVDNGQGSYTKYDFSCGEGTAWDTDIQTCNHIGEVARCNNVGQEEGQNKPMQDEGVSQTSESNDSTTHKTTTESSESNQISSTDSCESEGYFGNKQNCKKFYRCVDDGNGGYTKYDFDCGEGTIWDQDVITCNHPQDVVNPSCQQQSQTSSSSTSSTSSTQSNNIDNTSQGTTNCSQESTTKKPINENVTCEKAGYYANPKDCKKFYRCVDWDGNGEKFSVYHFECGEGTIWDPNLDTCNHEESVYPPRDCSGVQSQNENNLQESTTDGSSTTQQNTESTTEYSTTTEQSTTTENSMSGETTTQSTTSEHTTTQKTTTQQSTTAEDTKTEKTTQQSSTTESMTTEGTTTEKTTQESSTTESLTTEGTTTEKTTQQSSTIESMTTEGTTTEKTQQSTTESMTTQQSTTTEGTTTPQATTTEETQQTTTTETSTQSTTSGSTTNQQTTTTEAVNESTISTDQSTTEESTTEQSTTSQMSTTNSSEGSTTTEESTENQLSTTESMSTTEQKEDWSTTESSSTGETSSEKECPDTDEDQYLYVCPTSFRRHPKYCNMFYQCTEDDENHEPKIAVFTCPNNTIYDESKTQCVEESKAEKKCDGQIAQSRRIKRLNTYYKEPIVVGKEKYSCSSIGYYPFEKTSECSPAFFKCQEAKSGHLRGFVHRCPDGYLYWSISKRCERKENLKDCKTSSNDWSRRWEIPIERKNIAL